MVNNDFQIIAKNYELAGRASSSIKKYLKTQNISKRLLKRICSASFEAEINVVIHSYGGYATFDHQSDKIIIDFYDDGPGIADIELAMTEGYSTATPLDNRNGFGAGMGLSNIKRCTDELEITSTIEGTHLKLTFYLGEENV
jgi:anti-sigma regulatory factor (Ser/Thr protein kinase)